MNKLAALTLFLLAMLVSQPSWAEEKEKKKENRKSEGIALLLALDPFPGDALLYGEKYLQGFANLGLGLLFAGPAAYFAYKCADDGCGNGELFSTFFFTGTYGGLLVWDGVNGYQAVKEHNKKVGVVPHFHFGPNTLMAGATFTF